MAQKDPSKTEEPTQKRLDKARNDGQIAKSQEFGKVFSLIGGFIALNLLIGLIGKELLGVFGWFLENCVGQELNPRSLYDLFIMVTYRLAVMLLPYMAIVLIVTAVAIRAEVGPMWSTKVFEPKFSQMINIFSGIQKMAFNTQAMVRLAKNILSAFAIAIAPYLVLKGEFDVFPSLFHQDVFGIVAYILKTGAKMVIYALVPMVLIAIADLIYQRWDYNENMKMTKDEVKDERKQAEGDPEIKQQQRGKMFEVMGARMVQQVPEADVVITNPTHYAVALSYDALKAPAPICLAKGADHMAEKIKEVAREAGVPIRENKPLAQALYNSVEVGQMIPEEMYQAVASILAQLYKFKKAGSR
jgi:flagellar biosynthetic protein FlhB